MQTRNEYVAGLKNKLDQWNAELDKLEAKVREAEAQARGRYERKIERLKGKRDAARDKLKELQGATGDVWESLKDGAERMWDDLALTLREAKEAFDEGLHGNRGPGGGRGRRAQP